MSLQQQIQREIDEEARIEKRVEKLKNKFLKLPTNRKYRITKSKGEAHAFLVLNRNNLSTYSVISNDEYDLVSMFENNPNFNVFPLRNTNPHDSRSATNGDIKANLMPRSTVIVENS